MGDLNRQQEEIERETVSKLFDVLGRSAPYLALECVVAQGSSEEAHAVIHSQQSTYRVSFAGFEGEMALLLVTQRWDMNRQMVSTKRPSPYPLNLTLQA